MIYGECKHVEDSEDGWHRCGNKDSKHYKQLWKQDFCCEDVCTDYEPLDASFQTWTAGEITYVTEERKTTVGDGFYIKSDIRRSCGTCSMAGLAIMCQRCPYGRESSLHGYYAKEKMR